MSQKEFYYSKKNPMGPYGEKRRPDAQPKPSNYMEGQSSKKNLDEWSQRATRNSDDAKGK
jgi:hypothetical protein